jgi:hypothetical protein
VGGASSDPIEDLGPTTTLTISDQHFSGAEGYAINLYNCHDVVIERCTFDNVGAAMRVQLCTNVTIRDCAFWNIQGPGGEFPNAGVFVQTIDCDGVVVEDCWGVNVPAESAPEDVLSMFQSRDVTFQRNRIWGHGSSTSAATINLGDGGGCEYGQAIDNVIVHARNAAISVNGGDFMTVSGNVVYAERASGGYAGGVTVNNFYDDNCSAVEFTGNRMYWRGSAGTASALVNVDSGCGTVVDTGNTWNDTTVTESEWTPTGYYGWES